MAAPDAIKQLVERFADNIASYKSATYKEDQLRIEFLNPFWRELGWDMDNKQGYAEAYKDVIHEDSIRIGGYTKAPDYCFRIGGTRKFFLEAKKPSVSIKTDPHPAYQLRRYAWSAKLALSVLSDFEEFAVYDTRIRPGKDDSPATARIIYFTYDQYADKWDEIAGTFSRNAVLKGSFDKFADSSKKKRGTAEVDDAFLEEIERWRDLLARNFAIRNTELSVRDLNYAVQKTIDRLIFLRICEDRGTEDYGRLNALLNGSNAWPRLNELFKAADDRYNSGLFHYNKEKERPEAPDSLTPALYLDDKVLKDIIGNLYYPDSPYEFSVLPADILGQIYERFLGKTIRLTDGHQAKIEEKPEVRKAGGVYYTPTYIVDYIVKHTLGRILNGSDADNPKPTTVARAAKIKVLDPACGSGSFLIAAYQYLLEWYLDQYTIDPQTGQPDEKRSRKYSKGRDPEIYQGKNGQWRLTTPERKRILLNNIFGVDIDSQAVEVTKLSLLLKVLEGETLQQIQRDFISEHQRILPDLGNNIKCGNSLIGSDFYDNEQMLLIDDETQSRINVFDWNTAFPEIMERGGFDCVIGNPPYLSIDDVWGKSDPKLSYLKKNYSEVYNDKTDLFFYFLQLGLKLSRNCTGMIVSRAFLESYKADKLRLYLQTEAIVREIIDFRNYQVFKGVGIATAIIILGEKTEHTMTQVYHYTKVDGLPDVMNKPDTQFLAFPSDLTKSTKSWSFGNKQNIQLYCKIDDRGRPLNNFVFLGQGMQTGANDVFGKKTQHDIKILGVKEAFVRKRVTNSDIQRYYINDRDDLLLWLEDVNSFDSLPLALQQYLLSENKKLKDRAAFKRGNCEWWRFTWPLHRKYYERQRILCPYMAKSNRFAIDENREFIGLTDTTVIFDDEHDENLKYILGLLNSKLIEFRYKGYAKLKGGGIYEYFWNSIQNIPIRAIDFDNPEDVKKHNKMVLLVDKMLDLNKRAAVEHNPDTLQKLETQIATTDRQIDLLVYDLYDLTQEEIALVENNHE